MLTSISQINDAALSFTSSAGGAPGIKDLTYPWKHGIDTMQLSIRQVNEVPSVAATGVAEPTTKAGGAPKTSSFSLARAGMSILTNINAVLPPPTPVPYVKSVVTL